MNISTNYSIYNVNYNTPQFKGNNCTKIVKHPTAKKYLPKLLAVLLPLSLLQCMSNVDSRTSGKTEHENYTIEYFDIKTGTKDAIEKSLEDFEKNATNTDFLDDMTIDITKRYENLNNNDAYRRFLKQQHNVENVHGSSFYSDNAIPKRVCIQEAAHNDDKIRNLLQNFEFSSIESIDFTLMHELGHHFDKYYGHNHNAKFVQKREAMLSKYANQDSLSVYKMPKEKDDLITEITYSDNSGLSDKADFKDAFLKDLQNIAEIKNTGKGKLAQNIDYFIAGINFKEEINEKTVFIHDGSRAEVYANLFSYAVGKDDGDKETFIENFKNSYEIVKKDVAEYIGIK